jgi:hypothetical protein
MARDAIAKSVVAEIERNKDEADDEREAAIRLMRTFSD